ncbi:hypothetical protein ACFV9W_31410 [Streptomyces sp. NPDC059897]|uniref:hypothetical protein n=1 Tax=Streptomyces sp. NPDC059897 TaxID=3346994 RepID=UPI00366A0C82
MDPRVTVPIRLRLDAKAAADGSALPPLRAALARALRKATAVAPVGAVEAPTFRWHGAGLPRLTEGAREGFERELSALFAELCPTPTVPVEATTMPMVWLLEAMSVREAARRLYGLPHAWERLIYWYNRDLWADRQAPGSDFRPAPDGDLLRPGQRLRVEPSLLREPLRTQVLAATKVRSVEERTAAADAHLVAEVVGPVPRGSTVRIGLRLPDDVYPVRVAWELRPDRTYRALHWLGSAGTVSGPTGVLTGPENAPPHIWDLHAEVAGGHLVVCRLYIGDTLWQEVYLPLLVLNAQDLAWLLLRSAADPPKTLQVLRDTQQEPSVGKLAEPAEDQRAFGAPRITAEPDEAVTTGSTVRYRLAWPVEHHLHSEDTLVHWSVRALDPAGPGEWTDPAKRARDAIDWGWWATWVDPRERRAPTGQLRLHPSWAVTWAKGGNYEISCQILIRGVEAARHRQRVLVVPGSRPQSGPPTPRAAVEEAEARRAFIDKTLDQGETVPLHAVWVAESEEPAAVPLNLYATAAPPAPGSDVRLRIWDHSPGGKRRVYEGAGRTASEALDGALRDLATVPYPKGSLLLETDGFSLAGERFPARSVLIPTDGGARLADFLSQFSTFLFVTGALLAVAGLPYLGGPLMVASQLGTAGSAAVRMSDRYVHGDLTADWQTGADVLDVAGGATGVLRKITRAGALQFVTDVDGVVGRIQFVAEQATLADRLGRAVDSGDRRQIAAVLVEAARSQAFRRLGGMAERAVEQGARDPHRPGGDEVGSDRAHETDRPVEAPRTDALPTAVHPAVDRPARPDFLDALPAELRGSVRVVEDGRTVAVRYTLDVFGLPSTIEIHAGPDATAEDARSHLPTLRMLQRYQGLGGPLRILAERSTSLWRDEAAPMHFTRAWDARAEIPKLTSEIAGELARAGDDPHGEARRRIADLELQLAEHRWTLAGLDSGPGGVIAARDRRGKRRTTRSAPRVTPDVRTRIAAELAALEEISRGIRKDTMRTDARITAARKKLADAERRGARGAELESLKAARRELVEERTFLSREQTGNQLAQSYWRGAERRAALDRYPWFRARTPSRAVSKAVVDAAKAVDPDDPVIDALGNRPTDADPLTAEHIVSVKEIVLMEDFVLLTDEAALEILDLRENLVAMRKSTNSARRDTPWDEWQGWTKHTKDRAKRDLLVADEARLRKVIADEIRKALHRQLGRL